MSENDATAEKSIVDELEFGAKTAKRVGWESWEFTVAGPHQIEVTNASWGFQKDDHSYVVGIEERDGVPVPAECECKADRFREDYDCKHKVALASVGGPVVLQAALNYITPTVGTGDPDSKTLEERLRADGGQIDGEGHEDNPRLIGDEHDECRNGQKGCPGPNGDSLPCFACYQPTGDQ